jgi:hypothetical protein
VEEGDACVCPEALVEWCGVDFTVHSVLYLIHSRQPKAASESGRKTQRSPNIASHLLDRKIEMLQPSRPYPECMNDGRFTRLQ